MTEPVPQPPPNDSRAVDPVDPARELALKNVRWGLALFGIFWLLFGGTVLVAVAYLAFD